MRRNVLTTELLLPIPLGILFLIPFYAAGLFLGWSGEALGGMTLVLAVPMTLFMESTLSWIAPRLGLPPPERYPRSPLHRSQPRD
jgi:hypothetical protein